MKILVGWDNAEEAELIELYLGASGNEVSLALCPDELAALVVSGVNWDAVLMPTSFPDWDRGFELLLAIQKAHPECPVIGACPPGEMIKLARFLGQGMRAYVLRDKGGDFVFLLQVTVESVVQAEQAERERKISEKLREEVESVRKLQESIIPRDMKVPDGYTIRARYEPSQLRVLGGQPVSMAGGDYYDVFPVDEKNVVLIVGDASGHGMKACMSIMTMHTLVRMIRGNKYRESSAFVAEVNRMLSEQSIVTGDGGFITLLYGILVGERHELEWSSAGHPIPLLQNLETNEVVPLAADDAGGCPLGITLEDTYSQCVSPIPPHSRLLMFTDGLVEAFADDESGHIEFGVDGVIGVLQNCRRKSLDETLQELYEKSFEFTRGAGRHDDTSVLIMERA
ncbi:MAG TPA: SpoIIE family protein phosphatase [Planctomycetaceae bacterium]